jgi:hypothetical protein
LQPPKQIALFYGPKLYQPDRANKLTALAWYRKIVDSLIPMDTAITNPRVWHNDLHGDNIFVDPENPGKITSIIDWQSCHVSSLINHNLDPTFIDWDGLEPETLDLAPRPSFSGLSPGERSITVREYTLTNIFIGWRKLMQAKNLDLYRAVEFQKTTAYHLLFLAHLMFEYGEAHFRSLLIDLKDTRADLPAFTSDIPFPFHFSDAEMERINVDIDGACHGTELVAEVEKVLGDLWPERGFIEHELYEESKTTLGEVKAHIIEHLAESDAEKAEYERLWPFA